ncbi:11915_t:CDS:2, partial [Racocetra persica]
DTSLNTNLDNNLDVDFDSHDLNNSFGNNDNETFKMNLVDDNSITIKLDIEQYINAYAIKYNFATRLYHTEKHLGFLTRAEIVCHHAGAPSNKSTGLRKTKSVAISYSWKVVIHWAKVEYHVKSVELKHNHSLDIAIVMFDSDHCKLSNSKKQNLIKNLNSKLKDKFIPFIKDFKILIFESVKIQFDILWDQLLVEYLEASSYMIEQSKSSNAYLKHLLGHTVPLPKLIIALEKLSHYQLQHSQYQQYRLHGSIHLQYSKLLQNVSRVVSDFVYSSLLEQYNLAVSYDIITPARFNIDADMSQFEEHNSTESMESTTEFSSSTSNEEHNSTESIESTTEFSSSASNRLLANFSNVNHSIYDIFINQQIATRSTEDLFKDIGSIFNKVEHVKINNTLVHFVEYLNHKFPLLQEDIEDPMNVKTKRRPSSTKHKQPGAEHATKKIYMCSICNSARHNSRNYPSK